RTQTSRVVDAAGAPGVAAQQPPDRHQRPADDPELAIGERGVLRAGGVIAADGQSGHAGIGDERPDEQRQVPHRSRSGDGMAAPSPLLVASVEPRATAAFPSTSSTRSPSQAASWFASASPSVARAITT